MAEVAARVERLQSIQATLRHRTHLFGQQLEGTGSYRQMNLEKDLLIEMDLRIPLGDRWSTFQQIVDGRFLWSIRYSPDFDRPGAFKTSVQRADLNIVRSEIRKRGTTLLPGVSPFGLGFGGLPRLMAQLQNQFDFQTPQPARIYDVPMWVIIGEWKPGRLEEIVATTGAAKEPGSASSQDRRRLLAALPDSVTIAIGQDDLFPYRIEYRRRVEQREESKIVVTTSSKPMFTLEMFEVSLDASIKERDVFIYKPGNNPVEDVTERFLIELGLRDAEDSLDPSQTR